MRQGQNWETKCRGRKLKWKWKLGAKGSGSGRTFRKVCGQLESRK